MSGVGPWLAVYLAGLAAAGVFAARRTRDAADYYAAGGKLGMRVAALSSMSAAFSGFVFLGGPALAYGMGLRSWFVVLPAGWTAALLVARAAEPLRALARDHGALTLPEALGARFGSRAVRAAAALWLAVGCLAYVGVQLRATGILASAWIPGVTITHGIVLGASLVAAYAVAGGMKAAVWTDLWQGAWMLAAAVAVGGAAFFALADPGVSLESIAASSEFADDFFSPFAGDGGFLAFGFLFLFGLGVLGQPQTVGKFLMIDPAADLRRFPAWLAGSQLACLAIWFGVGLAIPAWVASGRIAPLTDPDRATLVFLSEALPPAVGGFVFVAALCAVMSTVDSFLNIGAAALARDLPAALGRPPGRSLRGARVASVALALAAAVLAILESGPLARFGTAAFGVFAAAFAPIVALGLRGARFSPRTILTSMSIGGGSALALEFARRDPEIWGALPAVCTRLPPSATALFLGFLVLVAAWRRGGSVAT